MMYNLHEFRIEVIAEAPLASGLGGLTWHPHPDAVSREG
jgi:hypothetical protein